MNRHLTAEDFVDALEDRATPAQQGHLSACAHCRSELDAARKLVADAADASVPEPSPLFWQHFQRRVREATTDLPVAPAPVWRRWWTPAGAAVASAVVLVIVLAGPLRPGEETTSLDQVSVVALPPLADDDGFWGVVVGLAAELDPADVQQVTTPAGAAADLMIEELSGEQRMELARLLRQEIGEP